MSYKDAKLREEATNNVPSNEDSNKENSVMSDEKVIPVEANVAEESTATASVGVIDESESESMVDKVSNIANAANKPRDKHEAFVRVAEPRIDKVISAIDRLAFLSNRKSYEYTDDEIAQMFEEITEALAQVKLKFGGKQNKERKFKFR